MPHKVSNSNKISSSQKNHKVSEIISALDFLRGEARKSGNEDIYKLIDSTFTICLHTFCILRRLEISETIRNVQKDA